MKQMIGRQVWVALSLLLLAGVATTPVAAQEMGERITILVPNLVPGEGLRDRFGNQVARELRSQIDGMRTHQTVSDRDLRDALRSVGVTERDLNSCIAARQLAMNQNWGLVVCGEYENVGGGDVQVTASFVAAESGVAMDVAPFRISERDARGAAQQLLQTFDEWQNQLRLTVFCQQYKESDQFEQAITNCERALAINPNSRDARFLLAAIHYDMENFEGALQELEVILEADPIFQDALNLAGRSATRLGQRDRARAYFDRYMELNPADVGIRLAVATDIANEGDPEGALRFAEPALEQEPDNLNLLTYIGHFAVNAASQAEQRLARNNGQGVDAAQISALFRTGADAYQRVFQAHGDSTDARVLENLVVARVKLGQTSEAVSLGRQVTEIMPDNPAIWDAYSRALEEAGQFQQALAAIERTQSLGRTSPALTQRLALLQLRQGNANAAIAGLRAAADRGDIDASNAFAIMFNYANSRARAGQIADALRVLEQAGPLATADNLRLARNFWMGYYVFEQAKQVHEPQTAESARRAKPMFERAIELFQSARGYERIEQSANVPAFINQARQFLEIQDALIRRGR
jgi:tetratricopeptide (TPR) repeat protein